MLLRTVLGDREAPRARVLPHEHIWCVSPWAREMCASYVDRDAVIERAVAELERLRLETGLGVFVDCTGVNFGRDVELLKTVSARSGVEIVCASGFYYNDEPVLYRTSAEKLAEYLTEDAARVHAGVIKAAVERPEIGDFQAKLLTAAALASRETGLPIVLHTNARNQNGIEAVKILTERGAAPEKITVGHLSDTEDAEYAAAFARKGCYIALDRLYGRTDEAYVDAKVAMVKRLREKGVADRVLLSHDGAVFQGFDAEPKILENTRFAYAFTVIVPALIRAGIPESAVEEIVSANPLRALGCG